MLSRDHDVYVCSSVAENPSCSPELLEMLGQDENILTRNAAAKNPSSPPMALQMLARDENEAVRMSVAGNPACPVVVLEELSVDYSSRARRYVAGNPSCTPGLFKALATDEDNYVRWEVARNQSCPEKVFKQPLEKDTSIGLYKYAASSPAWPSELLEEAAWGFNEVSRQVASNPSCPSSMLEQLVQGSDGGVRFSVASNLSLPLSVLYRPPSSRDDEKSLVGALSRLAGPRNNGLLDENEFTAAKRKLLRME